MKYFSIVALASVSSYPINRLAHQGQYDNERTWDKTDQYHKESGYFEKDPEKSYGMGNGQGSEKQDAIWHAAHNSATTEKFDSAMSENLGGMTAGNYAVPEPGTKYFTGNYAQRHPVFAQRDMGQLVDAPQFKWWTDGKGAGSEK